MKKMLHTVLQLSFQEYVQTWAGLINDFYQQGAGDDTLLAALALDEERELEFLVEYATVLIVMAVMAFEEKPNLVTGKARQKLLDQIVAASYQKTITGEDKEMLQACQRIFAGQHDLFSRIAKQLISPDPAKRQENVVGFARYLVARVSSREESENTETIQSLGILMSRALEAYRKLLYSSVRDTGKLDGTCNFAVKKGE